MKDYRSIPGPSKAPQLFCTAFHKYDGRNVRVEWSKKNGWHKFGSRRRLFDAADEEYGPVIGEFGKEFHEGLEKVFRDNKVFRDTKKAVAFFEWFGWKSFAGFLEEGDTMELRLIDVNIHKKGMLPPSPFIKHFGHLPIAEVVYKGNFNKQFIRDVQEGKYPVREGVVAKGINPKKKDNHNLWMAKVKTNWWVQELRRRAAEHIEMKKLLAENEREQLCTG